MRKIIGVISVFILMGIICLSLFLSNSAKEAAGDKNKNIANPESITGIRVVFEEALIQDIFFIMTAILSIDDNAMEVPSEDLMFEGFQLANLSGRGYFIDYICWDNYLVVTDTVYEKENGEYQKKEIVSEEILENLFGFWNSSITQYKNYLITFDDERLNFYIYNLDSQKLSIYPGAANNIIGFSWQVHNGKIYYMSNEAIYCMDMLTGENQLVYKYGLNATQFLIREDGAIVLEIYESGIREYRLLQFDEPGRLSVNPIWRTDEYQYDWWHKFNEYGLFLTGTFYYSQGLVLDEAVVLKDNGEKEVLPLNIQFISEEGYFMWEDSENPEVLLYYDFAGNLVDTYDVLDKKKCNKGYSLETVIYDDGEIYAFYCHETTGKLWIGRVKGESDS